MISRRTFVNGSTVVALAASRARPAYAAEKADVVVLGAGLAGMKAALLLKEAGLRCVVLEAADHPGGRVLSHATVDGPIDVGASQIGRSYARVIDTCRTLGLNLIPEDRDLLAFGAHYQGQWVDNATWATNPLNHCVGDERSIPPLMMGSRLASKYNPLQGADDWLDPRFAEYDISLRELLRRRGHSPQAIALAALSAPGISIDATSVLRMWQEETRGALDRRFGGADHPSDRTQPFGEAHTRDRVGGLTSTSNIEGGCQRLPQAMARVLGDCVRLNKDVVRIDMTARGASVLCRDGARYDGRFVLSAMPFTRLRQVEVSAAAGAPAAEAIRSMPYANTARLYLTVEPFWLDDGLPPSFSTDGPLGMFWAIDNHKGAGAHRAMVVLTGPVATAISRKGVAEAEPYLLAELARLRPASANRARIATYKDWGRDPRQLGCGFSLAPGQVNAFARTMIEPWQVMHFAGEHTRRTDFGMESAMESGERAAVEILGRSG